MLLTIIVLTIKNTYFQIFKWGGVQFKPIPPKIQTLQAKSLDTINATTSQQGGSGGGERVFFVVGNYFSEIRNTHRTRSDVYKYSRVDNDFKLYGEIESHGVTQIRFFQSSFLSNLFVSVANEKGNCSVFELDEKSVGRFRKYHEFESSCTSMEMFEQSQQGTGFICRSILTASSLILYNGVLYRY